MTLKDYDPILITAFLNGATIEEAAAVAKVSTRTVSRRRKSPEFHRAMKYSSHQIISYNARKLGHSTIKATETLNDLLGSDSEVIRLRASTKVLEMSIRYWKAYLISETVDDLEHKVQYLMSKENM